MTELDQVWSQMLAEAGVKADEFGRHHVADYLRLRAANDSIRSRGTTWLIDAFIETAIDAQRSNTRITIERFEPHEFSNGSATMVGTQIIIRHGVRCLSVEAGWTRLPSHGVMRGKALAVANITHFGLPKAGSTLRLTHNGDALPRWVDHEQNLADMAAIRRHFAILLGT